MVERRPLLARLSLGRTLRLVLLGLTLLLGTIAAIAIGNLYKARQDYEDDLARAYDLQVASSRLLTAGVVEEAALGTQGAAATGLRRRAADSFDAAARNALRLARGDAESERLVRTRLVLERRARRLARRRGSARRLAGTVDAARASDDGIAARQGERRRAAGPRARDRSRNAVLLAAIAGGLALMGALALIGGLIGSIRRPLEELVGATRRLAQGKREERVEPAGPQELSDLGSAFNAMAEQLDEAGVRIEAERHKLSTTIESLGEALVVCDPKGIVTATNPRAAQIVPELTVGARATAANSPLPPLGEALDGEVMREEGERTLSVTAAPLGEDEGTVWTIRDVSERARLERVKSDFVATASHELRSPLTSIKGFVELLARSAELGEREREFVTVILQSTDRLVDLVNDLLDVARLEAGKMEVHPRLFDLREVVHEVATLMRPRVEEKGQRLRVRVPTGLPRALADPVRMRQIITNLLSNAHLYTDQGGDVIVSVAQRNSELELSVEDTGRGMTEDELEHVFDRFVRREDGTGGTGLGLAIVRSLVDLQRGSIRVDSRPGEGTVFSVCLPAEPERGAAGAPRAAIRGKSVLVVDDEPQVASLIAEQLAAFEVEADTAYSGDEAIARLRGGRYDAMTLDILMPGRSGMDVLRAVRDDPDLQRIPVVIVSILSGTEALLGEWKVTKPIDPEELADVLGSAVMAGRTRVLVVGRSAVRGRLEPALVRLGLDHEWATSGAAAAQACRSRRFEVALVDAGIRSPEAVMRGLDLRGRRGGRAVVLFSDGAETEGAANLGGESVPIEDAAGAVLQALSQEPAER
jgi:signal transduction histidine kinase/CheY-like chemotaxis protein